MKRKEKYNDNACLLFLQSYTQYIPLSVYDLQTWMGSPSIFVYDCNNAGLIVQSFIQFATQREQEQEVPLWKIFGSPRGKKIGMS